MLTNHLHIGIRGTCHVSRRGGRHHHIPIIPINPINPNTLELLGNASLVVVTPNNHLASHTPLFMGTCIAVVSCSSCIERRREYTCREREERERERLTRKPTTDNHLTTFLLHINNLTPRAAVAIPVAAPIHSATTSPANPCILCSREII